MDLPTVLSAIGRRIGELREALGLTQADVAERLGDSTKNYQRIEAGERNITVETALRVANALGVPIGELFTPPTTRRSGPGRPRR